MARIMIADDSATERKILKDALDSLGHEVLLARDGEEAERRFFEERPDVLILDVIMPKKDGYQICRKIKTDQSVRHIPVIMISSKNQKSDEYWGLKQGADRYFGKPFDVKSLVDTVRTYLPLTMSREKAL